MSVSSVLTSLNSSLHPARILSGCSGLFPIRERYLFTRTGRLRVRYIAATAAALLLAGTATLSTAARHGTEAAVVIASTDNAATAINEEHETIITADSGIEAPHPSRGGKAAIMARAPAHPQPVEKTMEVGKGDTLAGLLQKAGVPGEDAYNAVEALRQYYDPRAIKPGQTVLLNFDLPGDKDEDPYRFSRLSMNIDPLHTVSLERNNDGGDVFQAALHEKEVEKNVYTGSAKIELSLYGSALKAGIPANIVSEAIRAYSWDIDFQRDIRRGDTLDVMYEQYETADGTRVKTGDLVYARLQVNGEDIPIYRYKMKNGDIDYFTADGVSVRKALMSTPIDGARLASGFGMRKHPVLGYNKMHKGIDFAAPTGTPIYAAGDGTIERIGKYSTYGNYIRIRHNSDIKTAYAHMSRFAKSLGAGSRVKQGQVIGYVGATGRVTGAHLHYEVLKKDTQTNPKSVKLPQGETLRGTELAAFKAQVHAIDRRYESLHKGNQIAQANQGGGLFNLR